MAKTVYDVLKEKIDEHIEVVKDSVASGACQDYAQYKELCGVIHGLALARREVQDLAKHMEDNDD